MCGECNWPMMPIPPIIIPPADSFPQPPVFNGPKEDKEASER